MNTFVRESAVEWVNKYRFDIAKIFISEDLPDSDALEETIIGYDPVYEFTHDELAYAATEVEYACSIILSHVYELVQKGKAVREGDDYIVPNEDITHLEHKHLNDHPEEKNSK